MEILLKSTDSERKKIADYLSTLFTGERGEKLESMARKSPTPMTFVQNVLMPEKEKKKKTEPFSAMFIPIRR